MVMRMLIDAAHPEETRVAVVKGSRIEEFDFETLAKAQLKGNIYLAKVTRVEPSLQAAFVEYGGNRHGFLAFGEIHPDYYQIPVADREALLAAEAEEQRRHEEEQRRLDEAEEGRERDGPDGRAPDTEQSEPLEPEQAPETLDEAESNPSPVADLRELTPAETVAAEPAPSDLMPGQSQEPGPSTTMAEATGAPSTAEVSTVPESGEVADERPQPESMGGDDLDDIRPRRTRMLRSYKIQEVIRRRQILLVQVVKEERGTKGAALTTYISLAGRYCVLMPNTPRGGGISRKITSAADRRRLKEVIGELEVPAGMALIVRTAGSGRTKPEIRRDFEYLCRLWDEVRETTLVSRAPALIHAEGDLIKRSVRDLYTKDIDEVWVDGDEGYKAAKKIMRMLMPSHAKRVQQYRDTTPLFAKFGIDNQLESMMNPRVQLRSGGYVIINSTEALVAIDVNSGRATRERNIEETALRTNFEAAEEVARQLRLRDLAGLIVIDFIDMEEHRNNRSVERRLKECLRADRARIQVGRISYFGLLEMSRQRLRPSLIEISSHACPTCHGSGVVRSTESSALVALRALEHEGINGSVRDVTVALPAAVGRYLLNQKRAALVAIEQRYGLQILIVEDDTLVPPELRMERGKEPRSIVPQPAVETRAEADPDEAIDDAVVDEEISAEEPDVPVEHVPAESRPAEPAPESRGEGDRSRRRRRRGRRGGRRRRQEEQFGVSEAREPVSEAFERESQVGPLEHVPLSPEDIDPTLTYETSAQPQAREASDASPGAEGGGRRRRRRRRRRRGGGNGPRPDVGAIEGGRQELVEHAPQALAPEAPYSPPAEPVPPPVEMVRESRPETAPPEAPPQPQPAAEEPPRERRRGWWNRLTS